MGWLWGSKKQKSSSSEATLINTTMDKNKTETTEKTKMENIVETNIEIDIMPTPNPNALKFISNKNFKAEGSSTYLCAEDCGENILAKEIFEIRGVDHLHLFENFITVTKFGYESWDNLQPKILDILNALLPSHDPNYFDPDPEEERRRNLPPELKKIEEILDRTIRPGLQGDGGDIKALSLENKVLMVRYQGACGTCPSSATGTLEAIKAILREEFDPDLDVFIAPEMY